MDDLIVYTYGGAFNYKRFVEKTMPLVERCIFIEDDVIPEDCDNSPAIEEMFDRMGIKKMDGKSDFTLDVHFTYIEGLVRLSDGGSGRYHLPVKGAVSISPDYAN